MRKTSAAAVGLLVFSLRMVGQTPEWTALGPADQNIYSIAIDPTTPGTIYAGTPVGVFKTTDSGATWLPRNSGLPVANYYELSLGMDPTTPSVLYAVANGVVYKTIDGSLSFTALSIPALVWSLWINPKVPAILHAATSDGIYRSNNGGLSWTAAGLTGLNTTRILGAASSPETLYATAPFILTFYRSFDGGSTWTGLYFTISRQGGVLVGVDPGSPSTVYAEGAPGLTAGSPVLWKTIDGGETWLGTGLVANSSISSLAIDPEVPSTLYAATDGQVSRSTDGGTSWVEFPPISFEYTPAGTVMVDPGSPSNLYVGTNRGIYRTTFASTCSPSATALCLRDRFRIEVVSGAPSSAAQTHPITSTTGAFWFFSPDNLELVVKVLDGRSTNGHLWVFYGALSNVQYTITVTDTQTGAVKTYFNPQGQLASVADTTAF